MPIYEFICQSCGKVFEKICRLADFATPICPFCGADQTTKKMSGFATSMKNGETTTSVSGSNKGFT